MLLLLDLMKPNFLIYLASLYKIFEFSKNKMPIPI